MLSLKHEACYYLEVHWLHSLPLKINYEVAAVLIYTGIIVRICLLVAGSRLRHFHHFYAANDTSSFPGQVESIALRQVMVH